MNYSKNAKAILATILLLGAGQGWSQCTDPLVTTVSEETICLGDELNLSAVSVNDGVVSWDLGVVNGESFIPDAAGVITYTSSSDNEDDCPVSVEITINELPDVEATADFTTICIGEEVVFNGAGAEDYAWDLGVVDGSAFLPAMTATYEVTGTDDNGCENTATIEVIVNDLPTIEAATDLALICAGEEVVLTGSGAEDYAWDLEVIDGEAFAPEATATYEVTGTDANGCENTATVEVVVNELPSVEATADVETICFGESVTLSGTGADTYDWNLDVTDGVTFAPEATATYEVTGTDANGCTNSSSIEIVVGNPEVTATADSAPICIGDEVILTGVGAESYAWTDGVIDGEAFAPVLTVTYEVTGTDANGCENTATIEVIVNDLPTIEAATDLALVCAGEEVILTGSGAEDYDWDLGVVDGESFAPEATATYEVTGTDANGCENTATVEVVVDELPIVEATADVETICLGESVTLSGSGAESYVWDLDVIDSETFAPEATATYEVTGTGDNGCENTATIEIVVGDPEVIAIADDADLCAGDEVVLTGGGADTYTWTLDVVDGEAFAPEATATYEVTGTDANGCVNISTIEVVVNELPTVDASADLTEVCAGDAIVLNGSGALTYDWTLGAVNGVAFAPAATATYEVTGTDVNGCEDIATIDIIVNALPLVDAIADDATLCIGDEVTLTGAGALTYTWTLEVVDGEAFSPEETATYEVTGTDDLGCINTATIEVTVGNPSATAGAGDENFCEGEAVILSAGGIFETFSWSPAEIATEPGTYTYVLTTFDEYECEAIDEVELIIHALPAVTASVDNENVCIGNPIILNGGGAETYAWDPTEIENGEEYTPEAIGVYSYSVAGTDANGCSNEATISVTVVEEIVITFTTTDIITGSDGSIDITVTGGLPAYTFDWDNDGTGDFDDSEDLTGLSTAFYNVVVNGSAGCSTTASIFVNSQVSIAETELEIGLYPNPTSDVLNVTLNGNFTYALSSLSGKVILKGTANNATALSMNDLSNGVYFITVQSGNETTTSKVVKK